MSKELKLFITLKRLSSYESTEWLQRNSEKEYGLEYVQALEMAYENMRRDAKYAVKGMRRPKK